MHPGRSCACLRGCFGLLRQAPSHANSPSPSLPILSSPLAIRPAQQCRNPRDARAAAHVLFSADTGHRGPVGVSRPVASCRGCWRMKQGVNKAFITAGLPGARTGRVHRSRFLACPNTQNEMDGRMDGWMAGWIVRQKNIPRPTRPGRQAPGRGSSQINPLTCVSSTQGCCHGRTRANPPQACISLAALQSAHFSLGTCYRRTENSLLSPPYSAQPTSADQVAALVTIHRDSRGQPVPCYVQCVGPPSSIEPKGMQVPDEEDGLAPPLSQRTEQGNRAPCLNNLKVSVCLLGAVPPGGSSARPTRPGLRATHSAGRQQRPNPGDGAIARFDNTGSSRPSVLQQPLREKAEQLKVYRARWFPQVGFGKDGEQLEAALPQHILASQVVGHCDRDHHLFHRVLPRRHTLPVHLGFNLGPRQLGVELEEGPDELGRISLAPVFLAGCCFPISIAVQRIATT